MTEDELKALVSAMQGEPGDLLLFAADKNKIVWNVLGALRLELAKELDLLDPNQYNFLWVTEFPLLEWSDEENRFMAMHHPFTCRCRECHGRKQWTVSVPISRICVLAWN